MAKRVSGMEVGVTNFGPISRGKITLRPLTIFIGPNNSGKSYAATLIHSIMESFTPFSYLRRAIYYRGRIMYGRGIFREYFHMPELLEYRALTEQQLRSLEPGKEIEIPKEVIESLCRKILDEVYERRLRDEITRTFACPIRELVKIGKRSFHLKIGLDSYITSLAQKRGKLKITQYPELSCKFIIKATDTQAAGPPRIRFREKQKSVLFDVSGRLQHKANREYILYRLSDYVLEICVSKLFKPAVRSYYLPAARSGILQGHKALAASIVKKAPSVGLEKLEIPKFSGVVADFISSVIALPQEKGPLFQLAQDFERELIKGEIVVRSLDEFVYPEIKYSFQKTEIPLHRSSSTVSELAPLFLYLKYSIRPGDGLIIEEPEAHLHPENQRILAKFLARLVRNGVSITITTHSEYLLEQLNTFIMLSKIEPEKRVERYKYSKEDYLLPSEVGAYIFQYEPDSQGHKINDVEMTDEGISEEEFVKIHEALYEETVKLRRDLEH